MFQLSTYSLSGTFCFSEGSGASLEMFRCVLEDLEVWVRTKKLSTSQWMFPRCNVGFLSGFGGLQRPRGQGEADVPGLGLGASRDHEPVPGPRDSMEAR